MHVTVMVYLLVIAAILITLAKFNEPPECRP